MKNLFIREIGSNIRDQHCLRTYHQSLNTLLSRNIETVIKTYESRVELSSIKDNTYIDRNVI